MKAEGRVGSQCKDADTTATQNGDVEDDIYGVLWSRCPNVKFDRVDSTLLTGHKTLQIPDTFQQISILPHLASQKKQCHVLYVSLWINIYIYRYTLTHSSRFVMK